MGHTLGPSPRAADQPIGARERRRIPQRPVQADPFEPQELCTPCKKDSPARPVLAADAKQPYLRSLL